jgi:hypothetical protein
LAGLFGGSALLRNIPVGRISFYCTSVLVVVSLPVCFGSEAHQWLFTGAGLQRVTRQRADPVEERGVSVLWLAWVIICSPYHSSPYERQVGIIRV